MTSTPRAGKAAQIEPRSRLKRIPERGHYDAPTIHAIIDEALICHVGFEAQGQPFVIPTLHARQGSHLLLHGAKASRMLQHIAGGQPVCVTFTLLDGIIFARSVFEHSMRYRSVVAFGRGRLLEEPAEKLEALRLISEHLCPGRWDDARLPNDKELAATSVAQIALESASAKIQAGLPEDPPADLDLPHWAGVLPLRLQALPPETDGRGLPDLEVPAYLKRAFKF